jgi:hypothetical protein
VRKLKTEPMEAATLLVPRTVTGGSPVHIRAGMVMSPPPPTAASINAPKKPKRAKNPIISKSIDKTPFLM